MAKAKRSPCIIFWAFYFALLGIFLFCFVCLGGVIFLFYFGSERKNRKLNGGKENLGKIGGRESLSVYVE